jgi:hypothetical protein
MYQRKKSWYTTEGKMKVPCFASAAFLLLAIVPHPLAAQDTPKPDNKKPSVTLKVQATITETEGEKKLANLPYTFFVRVGDPSPVPAPWTKVRIGSRVPVYTGKDNGMQYVDVGTSIDTRGFIADDGRFDIFFDLERSWVEGDVSVLMDKSAPAGNDTNAVRFKEPIIRQFKTELTLTMHDGQTIQTTQAADPISGRILTISLTINVMK